MGHMRFLEFFAGAGMARAALQAEGWECVFANDFDFKKARSYQKNWGNSPELQVCDVRTLQAKDLPTGDLVWGSFPCQDLSLAGAGAGLKGERSGVFYPFWELVTGLIQQGRGPRIIALENVVGALTSHNGSDFSAICREFAQAGYSLGAIVVDAALFVPQSRPRLFIIGVRNDIPIPIRLLASAPIGPFHTKALCKAANDLPLEIKSHWHWWKLPTPIPRSLSFADIIEEVPYGVSWHTKEETIAILNMMSPLNAAKVETAKRSGRRMVGGIYRRTRMENGVKYQRAEVRFDDVSGCLRTPAGGSSRQVILVVEGESIRTRLISPRETARLMGLPESYSLPKRYNEAYHLTGDGVVVPVVQHLASYIFQTLLSENDVVCEVAA